MPLFKLTNRTLILVPQSVARAQRAMSDDDDLLFDNDIENEPHHEDYFERRQMVDSSSSEEENGGPRTRTTSKALCKQETQQSTLGWYMGQVSRYWAEPNQPDTNTKSKCPKKRKRERIAIQIQSGTNEHDQPPPYEVVANQSKSGRTALSRAAPAPTPPRPRQSSYGTMARDGTQPQSQLNADLDAYGEGALDNMQVLVLLAIGTLILVLVLFPLLQSLGRRG